MDQFSLPEGAWRRIRALLYSAINRRTSKGEQGKQPVEEWQMQAMVNLLMERQACHYSGLPIDIWTGSIDHDIPASRAHQFPQVDVCSIANLRWVHPRINAMKGAMTGSEFLELLNELRDCLGDKLEPVKKATRTEASGGQSVEPDPLEFLTSNERLVLEVLSDSFAAHRHACAGSSEKWISTSFIGMKSNEVLAAFNARLPQERQISRPTLQRALKSLREAGHVRGGTRHMLSTAILDDLNQSLKPTGASAEAS